MTGSNPRVLLDHHAELRSAALAAFALVAVADGAVADQELARFESWLGELLAQPDLAAETLAGFSALANGLLASDDAAVQRARGQVSGARANPEHAELVLAAARIALVADSRIDEREEVALREICTLLGLDPDEG